MGAVDNWVPLQETHDAYYCVVDLHAATVPWDPAALRHEVVSMTALLMACGLDPQRSVLFVQSHVPYHSELCWILTCIARMGELRRMVQFKEKSKGESESIGVGLLTYPALQAADVLLYRAHGVPIGEDQRQHIELMRTLAGRFNSAFGPAFVVPEPWIRKEGARIMALDNPDEKMSKSTPRPASKILLTDSPATVAKKIRSAVTDSGKEVRADGAKPAITNLLTIFSLVSKTPIPELEERFEGAGYGALKQALADAVVDALAPIQKRYQELVSDRGEIERALAEGATRAHAEASATMTDVRARTGLGPPPG